MQVANTDRSWGAVQRTLHWTIAVMVLGQLLIGDIMLFTSPETVPKLWYFVHPTVGILIGLFMVGRLAWREADSVPAVPEDLTEGKQALYQMTRRMLVFIPMTAERQAVQDDPKERGRWMAGRNSALIGWVARARK